MTCIIGIEHGGKVYMGGDSAGTIGWTSRPLSIPKVFKKQNMLIGVSGTMRETQLLQYELSLPHKEADSPFIYLIYTL